MKKFLLKTPVTQFLIILFCGLLFVLFMAVTIETRETVTNLSGMQWLKMGINGALILLLTGLAFIIMRTVKVMNSKTLQFAVSEHNYQILANQIHEIIEKCDADGKVVYANDSFKKIMEYTDEEVSGLNLSDILFDKTETLKNLRTSSEQVINYVRKEFLSKSGKKIYLEGSIVLEYENKKFVGSTGFFNDVTEKRILEESLKTSEEKFRNLFNLAPVPMWIIDSDSYRFIHVNNSAIKHYGYSEEEFYNKTIFDIRPKEDVNKVEEDILKWKEENNGLPHLHKVYRGSFRHLKKSNELIEVEIYNAPNIENNKKNILCIVIDVTERNHNERKTTRAIIKAQEDERYEIGGELHDNVCQILVAAKMNLGRLKSSLFLGNSESYNQLQEFIVLAIEEIRNLSHRLAPAFFNNTDLEESFQNLIKTFNIKDIYTINMYFDKQVKNYSVKCDVQLNLYRIVQEQLRNIIKYAKGTLIEVDVLMHKDKLKLRIADDGIGFNVNEVKSGIGLSNIKRRADLFGGTFQIESMPGKGTEMMVAIPLHELD